MSHPEMTRVFTNGCFDVLHAGHMDLLERAKALGDWLIVGLNSDAAVRQLKGAGRPLQPWDARWNVLRGVRYVDEIVGVDSTDMIEALKTVNPNIWVKGGDYSRASLNQKEVEVAERQGTRIVIIPLRFNVHTSHFL